MTRHLRRPALAVMGSLLALTAQAAVMLHVNVDTHIVAQEKGKMVPHDSKDSYDVTLADKFFLVKSDAQTVLFDFDKRQRVALNDADKTRVDYSLYDTLGFRVFELPNRNMLGKMLAAVKVDTDMMGAVGNEHILALQEKPSTPLKTKVDGENESFSFASKLLFTRSLKSTAVAPGDARMFAQFVRYLYGGHPQILAALASGKAIPSRLTLFTNDVVTATRKIEVTSVRAVEGQAPELFAYRVRTATAGEDPLDQLLDRAANATDKDVAQARKHSEDELASLIREGKVFDVFLASIELSLMTGVPVPVPSDELKEKFQGDKSVQLLMSAMADPNTKEGIANSVKVLTELRGAASVKSHVLKIFEANHRARLREVVAARALFVEVLTASPYIAGAYKDLGDLLFSSFEAPSAWRCWDLGRRMAPRFANFEAVTKFERSLAADHPEYF